MTPIGNSNRPTAAQREAGVTQDYIDEATATTSQFVICKDGFGCALTSGTAIGQYTLNLLDGTIAINYETDKTAAASESFAPTQYSLTINSKSVAAEMKSEVAANPDKPRQYNINMYGPHILDVFTHTTKRIYLIFRTNMLYILSASMIDIPTIDKTLHFIQSECPVISDEIKYKTLESELLKKELEYTDNAIITNNRVESYYEYSRTSGNVY